MHIPKSAKMTIHSNTVYAFSSRINCLIIKQLPILIARAGFHNNTVYLFQTNLTGILKAVTFTYKSTYTLLFGGPTQRII